MQGRWKATAALLKSVIPAFIKKTVVPFILGLVGVSGQAWNFLVYAFLLKWWRKAEKEIDQKAAEADQKEIDDANIEKYKKDKAEGAPLETIIKDEENLLNGRRP